MNLIDRISDLEAEVAKAQARTTEEVERFRVAMLGRNGPVTELFDAFRQMAGEEKKLLGQRMNQLKQRAQARWEELKAGVGQASTTQGLLVDHSAPALTEPAGSHHSISLVRQRIVEVFARIGYTVSQGPEVLRRA